MATQTLNIPAEYIPYESINFCSNILMNVRYLINDKDFYPLLIGKGAIPKVWIFAKDQNNRPTELVNKSISKVALISVNIDDDGGKIAIVMNEKANNTVLLEIDYSSKESIVIERINLQPIGYDITGDGNSLRVGNSNVARNTLQNVQSFIGLG